MDLSTAFDSDDLTMPFCGVCGRPIDQIRLNLHGHETSLCSDCAVRFVPKRRRRRLVESVVLDRKPHDIVTKKRYTPITLNFQLRVVLDGQIWENKSAAQFEDQLEPVRSIDLVVDNNGSSTNDLCNTGC